jgi:3-oxoacyl-[acyl-carrier protein] reductase
MATSDRQSLDVADPTSAFRLDGRSAVVTGGASGIGRAISETLAAAGACVMIGDVNTAGAEETVGRITDAGGEAIFRRADVTRPEDVDGLVSGAVSAFGQLDIQCNIAGVPSVQKELVDVTGEQVDREMALTLKAVLYGCQAAARQMLPAGRGSIVNISSTAIDKPGPNYGLYHLGKLAVAGLTRVLASELGPKGIRVNAIAPGTTITNFTSRYFSNEDGTIDEARREEWIATMEQLVPLRMVGSAEDQALLTLYLVSDAARFVTGQTIRANGGWSMT